MCMDIIATFADNNPKKDDHEENNDLEMRKLFAYRL